MRAGSLLLIATLFLAGTSAADERPSVVIAPDESLTVRAYIEMGVPASDRRWSSADYEKFVTALSAMAEESPRQLPRIESPRSAALMKRVVSLDNLAALHDPKIPLNERLAEVIGFGANIGATTMLYVTATNKGESFDRELVELMAFISHVTDQSWTLVDEYLATLTPEERASRAGALETVRSGSAQVVEGAIVTFGETGTYRPAELVRLAGSLRETLPSLLRRLSAETAAELVVQLRKTVKDASDQEVAAALRPLLEAAEAAVPKG